MQDHFGIVLESKAYMYGVFMSLGYGEHKL